jgi:trans-aconitate methyltransferase
VFTESAEIYESLYRILGKDYSEEVANVTRTILSRCPSAVSLLDVGCGTGDHLMHLRERFSCEGLDLDQDLLNIAGRKLGVGVALHLGDMADFDLEKRYDAVICLFSSIGYVRTVQRLSMTAKTFAHHTNPGGIVIVEPWITPETWQAQSHAHITVVDDDSIQAVRMVRNRRDGTITTLEMHYLIATATGVQHRHETHELGLFSLNEYRIAFEEAGFHVEIDETGLTGRGLLIGRQQT